ncbi:MAG: hypothetical protein ACR2QE_00755 [Acidimicrobiales bacterium]
MTLRLSRLLAVGTVLVLLTAACASEPTAEERAAAREALLESTDGLDPETGERIGPSTTVTDTTEQPSEGSTPTTTTPEECTGPDCAAEPTAPAGDITAAINTAPTEDLRFLLAAAVQLSETAAAGCADLAGWTAAMDTASTNIELAAEAVLADGGDWLGTPDASMVAAAVRDQLILQRGCTDGAEAGDDAAANAALAAAGRASGANDTLALALTGDNPATGSDFWYHADQIGHAIEMQRLAFADPIDIVIIGSSTARRGFDPEVMTDSLGQSTMNAAVAALFPKVMPAWVATANRLAGTPSAVVLGLSPWQDFTVCGTAQSDTMDAAVARQDQAFAPLPVIGTIPGAVTLIGGPAASYSSPALDLYDTAGTRGWTNSSTSTNEATVSQQTALYGPQIGAGQYCPDNLAATESLISELLSADQEVLVVALPLHPDMAALHPDGRAGYDEAIAGYQAAAEGAGATWLDQTDALSADQFGDLTHANALGRTQVTAATIEALS